MGKNRHIEEFRSKNHEIKQKMRQLDSQKEDAERQKCLLDQACVKFTAEVDQARESFEEANRLYEDEKTRCETLCKEQVEDMTKELEKIDVICAKIAEKDQACANKISAMIADE